MDSQPHYPLLPRNGPKIDGSHIAPVIQILAWLLLTFSILALAAQFITKLAISRPFEVSDALLFAALVRNQFCLRSFVSLLILTNFRSWT